MTWITQSNQFTPKTSIQTPEQQSGPWPISTMIMPLQSLHQSTAQVEKQKINIDAFQADREVTTGEAIVYCMKTNKKLILMMTMR